MVGSIGKSELIVREVGQLPERELDRLLAFLRALKESQPDATVPMLAAESGLAKDWLTSEEDAAAGLGARGIVGR